MMAEAAVLLGVAGLGAVLGGLHFGGLWLTVRDLHRRERAMLWLLASTLIRLAALLLALYLLADGQGPRLLACLLGVLIARTLLVRQARAGTAVRNATP